MEIKSLPFISTTDSRLLSRLVQDPSFSLKMDPSFLKMRLSPATASSGPTPPRTPPLVEAMVVFIGATTTVPRLDPDYQVNSPVRRRRLPGLRPPTPLPAIRLLRRLRVAQGLRHRFPIFHGSAVGDVFATEPASEAFSPPSIYAESNGQGFDGGFGGSDDPILPPPSEMLPEEGFALRGWRR